MEKTPEELKQERWEEWSKLSFARLLDLSCSVERQYGGIMRMDGDSKAINEIAEDSRYLKDLLLRKYEERDEQYIYELTSKVH